MGGRMGDLTERDAVPRDLTATAEPRTEPTEAHDGVARPALGPGALRALVAHLPGAAAFIVDQDLRYVLAEGEALRAAGLAPADLVGKTIFEALEPPLAKAYEPMYRRALAGQEFAHEHESHGRVYVSRGAPLRDEAAGGRVYGALVLSYDITDRRRAEAELRASEERLRLAVAATGLGVFDWDLASDRVTVNARFREMLGLPEGDDVIGAAMLGGVVHPEDRAFVEAKLAAAFDPHSHGGYEFEHRAVTLKGEERWLLTFGQVYFAGEGAERRAVRVIGNDLDVTERKRAESAVRDSEARLQLALDVAELGTWEWDLVNGTGVLDLRGAEIVGLSPGELDDVVRAQLASIHHEDLAPTQAAVQAGIERGGGAFDLAYRVVYPDGSVHHVASRARVLADDAGRPTRLVGTNRDVTAEREAEARLRASEARHRFLLALNDRLAPLTDPDAIEQEATRLLGEFLGTSRVGYAEILPDGHTSLVTRNYTRGVRSIEGRHEVADYSPALLEALQAGRTVARADVATDPTLTDAEKANHAAIEVGATVDLPLVKAGRLAAVLFVHFRDAHAWTEDELTLIAAVAARTWDAVERSRAEAALRGAKESAEQANRAKSEFLAVMSHELRTPLNAIGGYAELIELGLRGPVTEQQREDLARIQQSQRHLLGLINQVLNYTRVDAGAVRYELAAVPVGEALAAAEALIVPQVRARSLTYVLGACPASLQVRADREKLQQILLNLLSNAIKFTAPGGEVRVHCVSRPGGIVAISVADTGVGIAAEKLASVFEPFVQVDQRLTRPNEGVGLGLAISRELARGMSGELTAESAPGVGSTFTLTLPEVSSGT